MDLIKKLFCYDTLYARIDLTRAPGYVVIALTAFVWSLLGNPTVKQYISRFIVSAVFMVLVRSLMVRLGTSRLSALLITIFSFVMLGGLSPRQLAEVGAFGVFVLVCIEFAKMRTKLAALGAGMLVGLLAIGEGGQATAILLLFGLFVALRLFWHALVEKISKIELILFFVKAFVAFGVSLAVYEVGKNWFDFPWANMGYIALPHIVTVVAIFAGLMLLRGLWATMLIQTERSPKARGIRMFLVFFGLLILLAQVWLSNHGTATFAPEFLARLQQAGLMDYTVQTSIFGLYAALLLLGAGIDRSLFRDTDFGQKIKKALK